MAFFKRLGEVAKGLGGKMGNAAGRAGSWLRKKGTSDTAKGAAVTGLKGGAYAAGAVGAAGYGALAGTYAAGRRVWRESKKLFMAINILLFASILFHYYDINTDFGQTAARGMIFLFFAVYAWLFIYSQHEEGLGDIKALGPPFLVSLIAILAPIILFNEFVLRLTSMHELFVNLLVLLPVWPIVLMFGMPTTRVVRWVRVAYVIFMVVAFLPYAWYSISQDFNVETMRVGATGNLYKAWDKFKEGLKTSYDAVKTLPAAISRRTQEQIQYAVGDYYTGQVEDNKNQQIGVYLEDVNPAADEFYPDEIVVVWATLMAKTLDPEKEITVTASCYGEKEVGEELKKVKGDADPLSDKDVFVMKTATEEEKYITCEFPKNFFKEGSNSIFVNAEFNFETMGYIKAYLMNLETLRTMKREGIDPLDNYKITDKSPTAVFTNGPIKLGMETSEVPIGISSQDPMDIKFGITLENGWQGKIKSVNSVTIKIPEEIEIVYCDHDFEKTACQDKECEDGKYTSVYRIKKEGAEGRLGLNSIKDVEGYHSIACRMRVKDVEKLLGNYQLITDYFKVTADYVYELEEVTAVSIKQPLTADDLNGGAAGGDDAVTSKATFAYKPEIDELTLKLDPTTNKVEQEFSVTIENGEGLSYEWKAEGTPKYDILKDYITYVFTASEAGIETITFTARDSNGNKVGERMWYIKIEENEQP